MFGGREGDAPLPRVRNLDGGLRAGREGARRLKGEVYIKACVFGCGT
jgi:hypothetical protein